MNENPSKPHDTSREHPPTSSQEARDAKRLDAWITARQANEPATTLDGNTQAEVDVAAELLALAASEQPDRTFVAELERTLSQQAVAASEARRASAGSGHRLHHWLWAYMRVRPVRRLLAGAALVAMVLALLLAGPGTRAALRNVLYNLAFVSPTSIAATPVAVVAPRLPGKPTEPMTLAEIRNHAPFAVRTPGWLPRDLRFTGGHVDEGVVSLVYHPRAGEVSPGSPALLLLLSQDELAAPLLLPDDQQVWTQVHGEPAIYLHGGWQGQRSGDAIHSLRWNPTQDAAWLTWEETGIIHFLQADGLGLGMEEMLRIAESLRVQPELQ